MKVPWATVAVFAITVAAIVTLTVTGHSSAPAFTVLVGILPALLTTSFFAEKSAKTATVIHTAVNSNLQAMTARVAQLSTQLASIGAPIPPLPEPEVKS